MSMRKMLSGRANWQSGANVEAIAAEGKIADVFTILFREPEFGDYEVAVKPRDLKQIYPDGRGIVPDFALCNKKTGRQIFVECKRQNARGNAHERACKYFAPGITERACKIANLDEKDFPFFLIFMNGIAQSDRYIGEITTWFDAPKTQPTLKRHLLIWQGDRYELVDFFDKRIRPLLDGKNRGRNGS